MSKLVKDYPYYSEYLWTLLKVQGLTGLQVIDEECKMETWFADNGVEFMWSDANSDHPLTIRVDKYHNGTGLSAANQVILPMGVYFKHESDMLAFNLRWGIHG
jgi:hypothetical protein